MSNLKFKDKFFNWLHLMTVSSINRGAGATRKDAAIYVAAFVMFSFLLYGMSTSDNFSNKFTLSTICFFYFIVIYMIVTCILFLLGFLFGRRFKLKPLRDYDLKASSKQGWYVGGMAAGIAALIKYFG